MPKEEKPDKSKEIPKKPTMLGWLFTKQEPDKDYLPELKDQWENMDRNARIKFVLGAAVGLVLFLGTLTLFYLLLSRFF
jgi:hypothetical protein